MKLYCLSDHPNAPCLLLKFKGVTILLDCGLDLTSLQHFLPLTLVPSTRLNSLPSWSPTGDISAKLKDEVKSELRESSGRIFVDGTLEVCLPELGIVDLSTVDAILVSNYHCILALPFITEYTGFRGTVYCTEPTKQTGRQLMEEFVEYTERVPKTKTSATWKNTSILKLLPAPLRDTTWVASWRKCYTKHDINACMSKVNVLGFSQKLNLFGSLRVTPHSSGYCLGSCNWVIKSEYEKVCYVSSSSFLTTHSIPIVQEPLKHSDLLLLTGITQTPSHNPDNMLGEFCSNLTVTIKNGGNVLVPCYPSGIIYDLFECLSGYLDSVGLTQVPMFFISPVAESSLAYSQIFSEWLCAQKQAKVFLPEPPFPHAELIKNNRLKHFSSIHGDFSSHFKTPCVVFTGHPSLRLGDAVHFMELWGKFSNNTVIFIEPNFSHLDALAPFQPLAMKACYCPIDTAISFAQATKMIKDLKPLHIALPECYLSPPASQPFRTEHVVEAEVAPTPYKRGSVLHLPIKRRLERIEITPELAGSLAPIEVKPGVFVATVTGTITARDNAFTLQEVPKQAQPSTPSTQPIRKRKREDDAGLAETAQPKQYVYGNLDVEELVQALAKDGITDVKVEDTPSGHIIHLQAEDTIIQLEEGSTHIFCEGNEPLRRKLRDTLIACLPSF